MNANSLADALEDEFLCSFDEDENGVLSAGLADPDGAFILDRRSGTFVIRTDVEGADDGLTNAGLHRLLTLNMPNPTTAGAFLVLKSGGLFELVSSVPISALTVQSVLQMARDQIATAKELSTEFAEVI